MFTSTLPALSGASCRPSMPSLKLPKSKAAKARSEAKAFLVHQLRSPWKHAVCRLRKSRPTTTAAPSIVSSSSSETLIDDSSSGSSSRRKSVRFDDEPTVFFRKSRIRTPKRSSIKLPERPCLLRRPGDVSTPTEEETPHCDVESIYEDCICDLVSPVDVAAELERVRLRHKESRRPFFYASDSGTINFDRVSYGQYCLSKYIEKERRSPPLKLVLHPLPPSPVIKEFKPLSFPRPTPRPPADTSPRSPIRCVQQCIVDEFENAVVVLAIGLTIYTCIFLFFLYNVFVRLFSRSQ